jgi:ABC-2 type transport system permease protein
VSGVRDDRPDRSVRGGTSCPTALGLPGWALKLPPFGWLSEVPVEAFDVAPVVGLAVVAAGLLVAAPAGFRRRDVPA